MPRQTKRSLKEMVDDVQGLAKRVFSDELDFLDDLPSSRKQESFPFPFGSEGARPYDWFSASEDDFQEKNFAQQFAENSFSK